LGKKEKKKNNLEAHFFSEEQEGIEKRGKKSSKVWGVSTSAGGKSDPEQIT